MRAARSLKQIKHGRGTQSPLSSFLVGLGGKQHVGQLLPSLNLGQKYLVQIILTNLKFMVLNLFKGLFDFDKCFPVHLHVRKQCLDRKPEVLARNSSLKTDLRKNIFKLRVHLNPRVNDLSFGLQTFGEIVIQF